MMPVILTQCSDDVMICFLLECLCMHLVNLVEAVTLSSIAKVDTLSPPLGKGEMVAPGIYHDIYIIMV